MARIRARREALRNGAAQAGAPAQAEGPAPLPPAEERLAAIRASLDALLRSFPRRRQLVRAIGRIKPELDGLKDFGSLLWLECGILVHTARQARAAAAHGLLNNHARVCRDTGQPEAHEAFRRMLTGTYNLTLPTPHGYGQKLGAADRPAVWAGIAGAIGRLQQMGLRVFLNSGTLLGVVREGDLIGHDDDIDLAVVLSARDAAAAGAEWRALRERLDGAGLTQPGDDEERADAGRAIKLRPVEGIAVDLFPAWFDGKDRLFVYPHTCGELGRADLEPLAVWGPHALPVPRRAERMLALNYGPGWQTPDQSFIFPWGRAKRRFRLFLRAARIAPAAKPDPAPVTVITYGTFDLFHVGHVRLLERLAALGDRLVVGCSTDEFNALKGKTAVFSYEQRRDILLASRFVAEVFPETDWAQKRADIARTGARIFAMGDDWAGRFDDLKDLCEVIYLPRTEGISSTEVKARVRSVAVAAG